MDKPLVLIRQELINDLVQLINKYSEASLPMFIIGDTLEGILSEVKQNAQVQYKQALENYHSALNKKVLNKEKQ